MSKWWYYGPEGIRYYGLDGQPISEAEREELVLSPRRQIGRDEIRFEDGRVFTVSTVFIGLTVPYGANPELDQQFDTMVFHGGLDETGGAVEVPGWRWPTLEEATEGHQNVVKILAVPDVLDVLEKAYRARERDVLEEL